MTSLEQDMAKIADDYMGPCRPRTEELMRRTMQYVVEARASPLPPEPHLLTGVLESLRTVRFNLSRLLWPHLTFWWKWNRLMWDMHDRDEVCANSVDLAVRQSLKGWIPRSFLMEFHNGHPHFAITAEKDFRYMRLRIMIIRGMTRLHFIMRTEDYPGLVDLIFKEPEQVRVDGRFELAAAA